MIKSPRTTSRRAFRSGFTLLELIFALMMTAMIVPVIYGALVAAYRAKSSATAAVEPPRTAAQALDWLSQDLGAAIPPSIQQTAMAGPFEGIQAKDDRGHEADDLQFYTVADSPTHSPLNGEIRLVELTVITAPNGDHCLVRKVSRDMVSFTGSTTPTPLDGTALDPDVEVICRGVSAFTLSYNDGTNWSSAWDSTAEDNTLPAAVQVTITLDRPNGPSRDVDGSPCFQFQRVIALPCSAAAFDSTVNTGTVQ